MLALFSNQETAPGSHHSGQQGRSAAEPEVTEDERTRRRCARIRSVPCVYLKCPPERKRNEQFALAALLGLDYHTHRREEVLGMINLYCPNLFQNPATLEEIFVHGNTAGIEYIVMRMSTRIGWNSHLAILGLARSMEIYRFLPSSVQISDDVVENLLSYPSGASFLGRYAPRPFLLENEDLILRCISRGLRSTDIPAEFMNKKAFMVKALAITPSILENCPLEILIEKDVLLSVTSRKNVTDGMALLESALRRFSGNTTKVLVPFAQDVKIKLDNHASFHTFLKGITMAGHPQSSSNLKLLQCGEETSTALKREIAEFLGAPTKWSECEILNMAWDNSVATYYHAHAAPKSEKPIGEVDFDARCRELHRQRRFSRQLMMVVRRDSHNVRRENIGHLLHRLEMVADDDDDLNDDGELENDLDVLSVMFGNSLRNGPI